MMCVGHYEIKPLIYEKFIEKNKCICTHGKLGNGVKCLCLAFQFNMINASHHIHTI
jgi:hypothetical protein